VREALTKEQRFVQVFTLSFLDRICKGKVIYTSDEQVELSKYVDRKLLKIEGIKTYIYIKWTI